MEEIGPEEALGGELKAAQKTLFKHGYEKKYVFHGGKAKCRRHHVDHGINRFVKFRPREHRNFDRNILKIFLNQGYSAKEDDWRSNKSRIDDIK